MMCNMLNMLRRHKCSKSMLHSLAVVVINPDFEEGIVQIGKGATLTAAQLAAVSSLVKTDTPVPSIELDTDDEDESYAVRAAKRLKQ